MSLQGRTRWLPRLGLLILINLLPACVRMYEVAVIAVMVLSLTYTAWIVLCIKDSHCAATPLHGFDRWLFRLSGPASMVLLAAFFMAEAQTSFFSSWSHNTQTAFMQAFLEVGLVLSSACLFAPRESDPIAPATLWKAINVPLWVIYSTMLVLAAMAPLFREDAVGS